MEGSFHIFSYQLRLGCLYDHILEQDLKRHGVSASLMGEEEFAIAGEHPIIVTYMMFVVIAVKSKVELVEAKTMTILSVSLGFLDFADHSIVHFLDLLFGKWINKKTRGDNRVSL